MYTSDSKHINSRVLTSYSAGLRGSGGSCMKQAGICFCSLKVASVSKGGLSLMTKLRKSVGVGAGWD